MTEQQLFQNQKALTVYRQPIVTIQEAKNFKNNNEDINTVLFC